ncbi:hypothetical protein [Lichenicoccus sp.]|uniref:hypothetical protein n=1 Tax=Lichenicoccus sp. TaxID=2781899 RepID=UPI003D13B88F
MELSDPSHPVLSGLLRKRQEIASEIEGLESRLHGLVLDIDAVDLTIRLFSPGLDVETVRVRPTPRRHGVRPGDTSKLVLSLLRENGPMSQRQITLKVMEHRGLNVADRVLYGVMRNRVGASLRGLLKRGTLVHSDGASGGVRWGLA